jgi:Zn-dependent protease with chaperone function
MAAGVFWNSRALGKSWFALVLGASLFARAAGAAPPTLADLKERADRELETDLEKLAPDALPLLREANQIRDKDPARAFERYSELHRRVPNFSGALRRMCTTKSQVGTKSEALGYCREAAKDETASNLGVLASVLLKVPATPEEIAEAKTLIERARKLDPNDPWLRFTECELPIVANDLEAARHCLAEARTELPSALVAMIMGELANDLLGEHATPAELAEAKELADTAGGMAPDEPGPQAARCAVAVRIADDGMMKDCVASLQALAPEFAPTHLYAVFEAANRGDWQTAEHELDRASALGAKPEMVERLRHDVRASEPLWQRYWRPVALVLGIWLAGLALLLTLGVILGRIATRAARKPATEATGRATGMSAALRTVYAAVIAVCCAYYYVSIPLVLVLVLAVGGGIVFGILAAGFIAPKLFIIVGLVVFATLGAMLRSLFVRVNKEDPGLLLDLSEHPRLAGLLSEVAGTIGARNVDRVFIVPDATVSVFERGGVMQQMRGQGERCLVIGAAVLHGMNAGELRAILAHEFGHFSNRDTAGGQFALAVRNSLHATVVRLARSGAATRVNPAWLFVTGYWKLFLRISQGASRLQEVLADRWAAHSYGVENFVRGLRHVVRASVEFSRHVEVTVNELAKSKAPLLNLYRYEPGAEPTDARPVDELVEEALNRPASPFDSHPPPQERIALVRALNVDARAAARPDDETSAWELVERQAQIEEQLTRRFCEAVYQGTGIRIKAPA